MNADEILEELQNQIDARIKQFNSFMDKASKAKSTEEKDRLILIANEHEFGANVLRSFQSDINEGNQ